MAEQLYSKKSFIISFKPSMDKVHYAYLANNNDFEKSVIYSLFNNDSFIAANDSNIDSYRDDQEFKVRFVIHSHKDFSIGQVSYSDDVASFAQHFFPDPAKKEIIGNDVEDEYLPIVHITLDDRYVDNLYSTVSTERLPEDISRSYQILDNSIWNKIVPFDRNEKYDVGGSKGLFKAIQEIDTNYQNHLYDLQIAHEFANLNARLTKQAYLIGSHATGVSPFIFHSESAIAKMAGKEFENKKDQSSSKYILGRQYRWRILLVDDKANDCLAVTKGKSIKVTKNDILIKIFYDLFHENPYVQEIEKENKEEESKHTIIIDFVKDVENANKALRKKEYDIILLDYFLENNGNKEYGYQLLEDIYQYQTVSDIASRDKTRVTKMVKEILENNEEHSKELPKDDESLYKYIKERIIKIKQEKSKLDEKDDDKEFNAVNNLLKEEKYIIGPHNKLFFMFISAYSTAVHERLLAESINRSEKFWYIGEGACPTNTPELFKYHLLHLMQRRLDDTGIKDLNEKNFLNTVEHIFISTETDKNDDDWIEGVRERAYNDYHKVLGFHYDYSILRTYDRDLSELVKSFLDNQVHLGAMLEHLLQFIHLTAFGTVRQWPEIWEEYKSFTRTITYERKMLPKISSMVEKFIIALKSA